MSRSVDPADWARSAAQQGFDATAVAAAIVGRIAADLGLDPLDERAPALASSHPPGAMPEVPQALVADAWTPGRVYEVALGTRDRRAGGVHYTPPAVARLLATIALDRVDTTATVCDPAVGGGSFLLAAAELLESRGAPVDRVVATQLWGVDIDADARQVCAAALACHAASRTGAWIDVGAHLVVADTLAAGGDAFGAAGPGGFDVVLGNPPFQSQLAGVTARTAEQGRELRTRWQVDAGAYADSAGYFLLAGIELTRPGGRSVMIQPRSTLATADAAAIREAVLARARLTGMWTADRTVFDADVWVCALVIDRDEVVPEVQAPIRRWRGVEPVELPPSPGGLGPHEWGRLAVDPATMAPAIASASLGEQTTTVASLATATAGFREQFYGLAPHTAEADGPDEAPDAPVEGTGTDAAATRSDLAPLLTVGMIEPLRSRWGDDEFRYAGRRWRQPVVDVVALDPDAPRLAEWVRARRRPKLVVATQTRVIEVVVDLDGRWIPSTPAISVEAPTDVLFHLAAALTSPVATAVALDRVAGAALSGDTIKLSARQVLDLPLPAPGSDWDAGAACAEEAWNATDGDRWRDALVRLGRHMIAAAGVDDPDGELLGWWVGRLPPWR